MVRAPPPSQGARKGGLPLLIFIFSNFSKIKSGCFSGLLAINEKAPTFRNSRLMRILIFCLTIMKFLWQNKKISNKMIKPKLDGNIC